MRWRDEYMRWMDEQKHWIEIMNCNKQMNRSMYGLRKSERKERWMRWSIKYEIFEEEKKIYI